MKLCFLVLIGLTCYQVEGDFVKRVHIIYMNHLDVGYSFFSEIGFVSRVLNGYFHQHFPKAANISLTLRQQEYVETFIYTTHPWLVTMYLNCPPNWILQGVKVQCPNKIELANFTAAVKRGDITWHAGPMNMQAENSDETLFQFGLSLSDRLDKLFGIERHFKTLSQRDVPGMTRAVIPSLVKMNISGISVGVNPFTAAPAVPKGAFLWKYNEQSVLATWHPGGYPNNPGPNPSRPGGLSRGDCLVIDNFTDALCFAFRADNSGPPQSIQEVLGPYEILREEFPDAKLHASTFENFFSALNSIRDRLPIFEEEVGDTWMQGTGSDPKKTAQYRAIYRVLSECVKSGQCNYDSMPELVKASTYLVKPGEHTWGISSLNDNVNWTNAAFQKAKNGQKYTNCKKSWKEQRQFIDFTLASLEGNPVAMKVQEELANLVPHKNPDVPSDYKRVTDPTTTFNCFGVEVGFGQNGAITTLLAAGNSFASSEYPLSMFHYATYNQTDFNAMIKAYGIPGFDKPNATKNAKPVSKTWSTTLIGLYANKRNPSCDILTRIVMTDQTAVTYYGAPQMITVRYLIVKVPSKEYPELRIEYNLFNKTSTRLAESMSVMFTPLQQYGYAWRLSKLGHQIDPGNVVANGSQYQHGIDNDGVFYYDPGVGEGIQIQSMDVPLVLTVTETRPPYPFPIPLKKFSDRVTGMAFNIYNNIWNTNYIYYYPYMSEDQNFKARFVLRHYMG